MTNSPRDPFAGKAQAIAYMGNNEVLYAHALARFYENYEDIASKIASLVEEGSYDDARLLAHSLKGLSRTLGMTLLGNASEKLQHAIESRSNISTALEEFSLCLKEVYAVRL